MGKIGKKRQKSETFFHFAPPDREGCLRHCPGVHFGDPLGTITGNWASSNISVEVFVYTHLCYQSAENNSRDEWKYAWYEKEKTKNEKFNIKMNICIIIYI